MPGRLLLLPNVLYEEEEDLFSYVPASLAEKVTSLQGLIAENEKEGRRYLKRFTFPEGRTFRDIPIRELSEHTKPGDLPELLNPLVQKEETWGLISDAGLACIADPGASLVALARQKGVTVQTVVGPSSFVLALQLSGLSAQAFSFHGYLPRDPLALRAHIKELEKNSRLHKSTQICIEAPYRTSSLFHTLLETLSPSTLLCLALHLTAPDERVETRSVQAWQKHKEDLPKQPAVFLFLAS